VKRRICVTLGLAAVALALPAPVRAAASCGVPADTASQSDKAGWMAQGARAAGLPGELPVMASLVDAGLQDIDFGDSDSRGYFAMRVAIWDNGKYAGFPDDPALQLQWFIDQALAVKRLRIAEGDAGFGSDPSRWGEWDADVMQPADEFRGRYQLRLDEARALVAGSCAGPSAPPVVTLTVAPQPSPGHGGWLGAADGAATASVSATGDAAVTGLACTDGGAAVPLVGETGASPRTASFTVSGDGSHALACTAGDAEGAQSAPATATVALDRTAPVVAYTGNAGSYALDATVAIACSATDALSGIDPAATSCAPITGPAYRFAPGANTFTATAADVAGNTASATASFVVAVTGAGLGDLTTRFVQGSAAYRALRPAQRAVVDQLAAALSRGLQALVPRLSPAQRQAVIRLYQAGVGALVAPGWLTADQAATLQRLANAL
jgi:hypothetical protein